MKKSRFRVPHTLVLLFGMIVVAYSLTLLLPAGQFERITNEDGREQVVPGTYERLADAETLSPLAVFTAIPRSFAIHSTAEIIFFILIVGGFFAVFRATGAVDASIGRLIDRLGHRPFWLVAGAMAVFAVGSSTIGMAEEYIPFIPVLITLFVALGFDTVTAVAVVCIGYGVGYGAAALNPFTVLIAQGVAGLEPASGQGFRWILLAVFFAIALHHVWSYARRVKADPDRSLVAGIPVPAGMRAPKQMTMTGRHGLVLVALTVALGLLIWGIKAKGWYLVEMGSLFLILTLAMAVIAGIGPSKAAKSFCNGASELTTTALLIGFARAIETVLNDGQVIDTVIHGIAQPLQQMGATAAGIGMFFVQSLCNLFVPSGSGQAFVTMPIMAPLADLVGVSRQVAVLAYQFGDGFTNILVPTNAVLIGILTLAGIPYDRWFRLVFPFMLKVWVVGSIAIAVAIAIGLQ
ncbi:MAG: TIGR00366 family protein [Acidobacteriota bacterium]